MASRLVRIALLLVCVLGLGRAASAQTTWRVGLELESQDEVYCSGINAWEVFQIPANGTSATIQAYCPGGATMQLTIAGQTATLEIWGAAVFDGCDWQVTSTIRGSGFISGDAVPSTALSGLAHCRCPDGSEYDDVMSGSFQAVRVGANNGSNPTIAAFTGVVQVIPPTGHAYNVTNASIGAALDIGTRIGTFAASSITLTFPSGNLYLGADDDLMVMERRYFLLVPSVMPVTGTFARITWRCIPGTDPCASMAMPTTRLQFNPPIRSLDDRSPWVTRAAGDTTFTAKYTETGGLGTTEVTVDTGTVEVTGATGRPQIVNAGETQRFTSFTSAGPSLNFDGDIVPDQLLYSANSAAWLVANGSGTSTSGQWPIDRWVADHWTAQVGDFNGDGLTDIWLTPQTPTSNAWAIAVSDGHGSFTYYKGDSGVESTANMHSSVLNLNGDRASDILWHDPATGRWVTGITDAVLTNGASTTFRYAHGMFPAGAMPIPLNLNDDDLLDLLLFNASTGALTFAINDGVGGFTLSAQGSLPGVTDVYPGDFNGDGLDDAFLYNRQTGAYAVALNNGTTLTTVMGSLTSAPDTILVGDLNADGKDDVFGYSTSSGAWLSLVSNGAGVLTPSASGVWAANWQVTPAEFNGDGRLDLFLYYAAAGTWRRAINTGLGDFTYQDGLWPSGYRALTWQQHTQGPVPNEAPQEPCASESSLQGSLSSTNAQSFWLVNGSAAPRTAYVLSGSSRQLMFTMRPGEQRQAQMGDQSVWVVTDTNGACQAIYVPGSAAGVAVWPLKAVLP
ncbi:MAG TPA: VCBS repeat-containing protein [Vicinamibacterales bacterium]|nr:VCBS repeat-containing protein [Vicinamibacterales bacterium]